MRRPNGHSPGGFANARPVWQRLQACYENQANTHDMAAYDALIENLLYSGEPGEATKLIDESIGLDSSSARRKAFSERHD